jgi:tRNA G10  N-methylase Trm11
MKEDKLMAHDPLSDADAILTEEYYGRRARAEDTTPGSGARRRAASGQVKPTHYKVICISMYTEDLKRLDTMVDSLKARGLTKANRSALIRYALGAIDLDNVPKGL